MSALTRGVVTETSSTVSTAAAAGVSADVGREFLQIINNHQTNSLAYTLDGSNPVINGNGVTLFAGGSSTYDTFVPTGAVRVIGSGSGTGYTIVTG